MPTPRRMGAEVNGWGEDVGMGAELFTGYGSRCVSSGKSHEEGLHPDVVRAIFLKGSEGV